MLVIVDDLGDWKSGLATYVAGLAVEKEPDDDDEDEDDEDDDDDVDFCNVQALGSS
jgi:hypothetical protein